MRVGGGEIVYGIRPWNKMGKKFPGKKRFLGGKNFLENTSQKTFPSEIREIRLTEGLGRGILERAEKIANPSHGVKNAVFYVFP
jgi:hypothetical protein